MENDNVNKWDKKQKWEVDSVEMENEIPTEIPEGWEPYSTHNMGYDRVCIRRRIK